MQRVHCQGASKDFYAELSARVECANIMSHLMRSSSFTAEVSLLTALIQIEKSSLNPVQALDGQHPDTYLHTREARLFYTKCPCSLDNAVSNLLSLCAIHHLQTSRCTEAA